jgi:hypothetical protein
MKSLYFLSKLVFSFVFVLLFSCNNEDINTITAIKLESPEGTELLVNQEISFSVKANNSEIITEDALIKINGESIEGFKFSSAEPGTFEVQAFYKEFKSNKINISSIYPSGYIKNLLIEDYTGTWCSNCPGMAYAIEQAKTQSDKIVSVGVHAFDQMEMPGFNVLTSTFTDDPETGLTSYPTGMLNRINFWENPDENIETAINMTGYGADLGLSISSSISGDKVDATIKVGFDKTVTTPLKLVVYLTENGLHYNQQNSTDYYGGLNPLVNFEHNDVLRAFYTDFLGEVIPSTETQEANVFTLTLSKDIPASAQNNNQLHLVAFVSNATTNEVINVREVKIGEAQELQEL